MPLAGFEPTIPANERPNLRMRARRDRRTYTIRKEMGHRLWLVSKKLVRMRINSWPPVPPTYIR